MKRPKASLRCSSSYVQSHPVFFADPACVLKIPGPGQSQGPSIEVAVGEHVCEAEGVEVLLRKQLKKCLDAVVAGEFVSRRLWIRPDLDAFDDEIDVVGNAVAIEV